MDSQRLRGPVIGIPLIDDPGAVDEPALVPVILKSSCDSHQIITYDAGVKNSDKSLSGFFTLSIERQVG